MEQKAKFIIIGLAVFALACLFLFIQTFSVKQQLTSERDALKTENTTLNTSVNKLTASIRNYESKISSFNNDLNNASQQKIEIEKKYEAVNKEKEELSQKLKGMEDLVQKLKNQQFVQEPVEALPAESKKEEPVEIGDAYWAGVLKAKGELEFQLSSVRSELKSIQITNEQLQREKGNLELDLNNLKREREDLKRQFDYNQKLMDSIAQELVREKNDKKQINDSYKKIRSENITLSRQLQSLSTRKIILERKIQALQEGKETLGRRIDEMETMLTDKVMQADGLKERIDTVRSEAPIKLEETPKKEEKNNSVELPAIVVRPQPESAAQAENPGAGLTAKVLAVNKDSNFVIIDLGQDAGIKIGDAFKIYRGVKPVASVEVIQVRRNISACDIKKQLHPVKIGDVAR